MDTDQLSSVFQKIQSELELPEYIKNICTGIIDSTINKEKVQELLLFYGLDYSIAKKDLLRLIFEYIKIALDDDILTFAEKENIKLLKNLFHIKAGDFFNHCFSYVEVVVNNQFQKIYEDDYVSSDEAFFKVDLQETFDLTFDQMNDFSKIWAVESIQKGVDPFNLDVFFTQHEYFKIKPN